MKRLFYLTAYLGALLVLFSCDIDANSAKYPDEYPDPNPEEAPVEIEHEIDAPFLYPFGLDLENFNEQGYRSYFGGDCYFATKAVGLGEYTLMSDSVGCSDYGFEFVYLLFRGEELIALHEETVSVDDTESEGRRFYLIERTIDFENEKTFIRRDTAEFMAESNLKGAFAEEIFDRSLKEVFIEGLDDPREYQNFESNDDFYLMDVPKESQVQSLLFKSKLNSDLSIFLTEGYSVDEIEAMDQYDFPEGTLFAYSSWWRGDGEIICGRINEGVIQIYSSYQHEEQVEADPFELFLEIDPNVTYQRPDHYIVFDPKKGKNKLMLALNGADAALYAKYENQARHIELREIADESKGKKIVKVYQELIHGIPNGTYTHTHEGIYDYVAYKGLKGKEVAFTINHDLSTQDSGGYRDRPLF